MVVCLTPHLVLGRCVHRSVSSIGGVSDTQSRPSAVCIPNHVHRWFGRIRRRLAVDSAGCRASSAPLSKAAGRARSPVQFTRDTVSGPPINVCGVYNVSSIGRVFDTKSRPSVVYITPCLVPWVVSLGDRIVAHLPHHPRWQQVVQDFLLEHGVSVGRIWRRLAG